MAPSPPVVRLYLVNNAIFSHYPGVTHATIVYWEYFDLIRQAAEERCSYHIQKTIATVDKLLSNRLSARPLKALFGLSDLEHNDDFASLLEVCLCVTVKVVAEICTGSPWILASQVLGPEVWQHRL